MSSGEPLFIPAEGEGGLGDTSPTLRNPCHMQGGGVLSATDWGPALSVCGDGQQHALSFRVLAGVGTLRVRKAQSSLTMNEWAGPM